MEDGHETGFHPPADEQQSLGLGAAGPGGAGAVVRRRRRGRRAVRFIVLRQPQQLVACGNQYVFEANQLTSISSGPRGNDF